MGTIKQRSLKRRWLQRSLPLLLCGCGAADLAAPAPEPFAVQPAGMNPQGERLQATQLGSTLLALGSGVLDSNNVPYDLVQIEQGELVAYRNNVPFRRTELVGARIKAMEQVGAPANIILTINAASNHRPGDPASVEWEYEITYEKPGQIAKPLCLNAQPGAMAFQGYWQADGTHFDTAPGIFSFACHGGVIMKCSDWGYKPWAASNKTNPPTPLDDYHQTCTRMARADYCSTGDTNTLDGTPIDYYDNLGINVETLNSAMQPVFPIEAMWKVDGGSTRPGLLCLSKRRWDTLPLGGSCSLNVADPRLSRVGRYCEDQSYSQWVAEGAILGNDSLFIDRGLFRWLSVGGNDQYSSSHYIWRGAKPSPTGFPPGYSFVEFEGAVFANDLANQGLLPAGSLVPLYSYYSPARGDRFTTSHLDPNNMPHPAWDALPKDYANPVLEGWIYKPPTVFPSAPPHPRAKLLVSWYSPSRKEHTTSREKPMPASNPDYQFVRIEGYVLYKK